MNLIKDLQDEKYWDLGIKGNARVLQLRQEWDRDTCIKLRDEIMHALRLQELVIRERDELCELAKTKPFEHPISLNCTLLDRLVNESRLAKPKIKSVPE